MCFLVGAGKKKNVRPVRNISECDDLLFSPFFFLSFSKNIGDV